MAAVVLTASARADALTPSDRLPQAEVDTLLRMEKAAERVTGDSREAAWYGVARRAVILASMPSDSPREFEPVRRVLRNACERLPAASLAAVAAHGRDPILSAAFARAVQKVDMKGRGGDVTGPGEAASECRDAIARHGPSGVEELLSIWKKAGPAGPAPGGASASVYKIMLVVEDLDDSTTTDPAFGGGFRAGIAATAGAQAERFVVEWGLGGVADPKMRAMDYAENALAGHGVSVVASGDAEIELVLGAVASHGIPVLDARDPQRLDLEQAEVFSGGAYYLKRRESVLRSNGPWLDEALLYSGSSGAREVPILVGYPIGFERGRRLVAWLRTQRGVDTVGVALPEVGGDVALASACTGILSSKIGDDPPIVVVPLSYAAGLRDYSPEVRDARRLGCKALILCGPAEECAEWLRALQKSRTKLTLLGGDGLEPSGLRDAERVAAEGAVFVGANWRVSGPLRPAFEAASQAIAEKDQRDFERGFVAAASIVRRVVAGNCSPAMLCDAFADESPQSVGLHRPMLNPGSDPARPGSGVAEVPLYRIRGGVAERIASP